MMPFAGWVSDKIDRRRLYAMGAVAGAVWILSLIHI